MSKKSTQSTDGCSSPSSEPLQASDGFLLGWLNFFWKFLIDLVGWFSSEKAALLQQVAELSAEKTRLEEQLNLHSRHSHQPSSQDKPGQRMVNSRPKGLRRPGGQPGHRGSTLPLKKHPTETVIVRCDPCAHCGAKLSEVPPINYLRRQVWDIPEVREAEVIEYMMEVKKCPVCKKQTTAPAPQRVYRPCSIRASRDRLRSVASFSSRCSLRTL